MFNRHVFHGHLHIKGLQSGHLKLMQNKKDLVGRFGVASLQSDKFSIFMTKKRRSNQHIILFFIKLQITMQPFDKRMI